MPVDKPVHGGLCFVFLLAYRIIDKLHLQFKIIKHEIPGARLESEVRHKLAL